MSGQSGEREHLTSDAPRNSGRHPPGDVLPPPPQRATPACKGARCGAGAGSPRPHRPHPGHTGCGTPAGGGTASDTRRPSQRAAPHHPTARSSHRACRPRGRCRAPTHARPRPQGKGQRPAPDPPSQRWRATPPGTAPTTPAERGPPRACKPRGQRRAPTPAHLRPRQEWRRTDSPPRGRTVGGGGAPDRRRTSQRTTYPHTRAHSMWAAGPDSPQEGGSRRGESARPRTPLSTGLPQTAGGRAPSAHTHTRTPARGTSVRAPPPTLRGAHSTCTSHGKSPPHPLLLGTATQQWRNPRPHAKHAPNL